jgi:hypothetical protein
VNSTRWLTLCPLLAWFEWHDERVAGRCRTLAVRLLSGRVVWADDSGSRMSRTTYEADPNEITMTFQNQGEKKKREPHGQFRTQRCFTSHKTRNLSVLVSFSIAALFWRSGDGRADSLSPLGTAYSLRLLNRNGYSFCPKLLSSLTLNYVWPFILFKIFIQTCKIISYIWNFFINKINYSKICDI